MDEPTDDPPLRHWLPKAFGALSLSALCGAGIGMFLGGQFIVLFGYSLFVLAAMAGYAAGLFGAAIGGYRGWTLSGGSAGFLAGCTICSLVNRDAPPDARLPLVFVLLFVAIPTVVGLKIGYQVAKGVMTEEARESGVLAPLRRIFAWSRLYDLPIEMRLLLAAVNLAIAVLLAASLGLFGLLPLPGG